MTNYLQWLKSAVSLVTFVIIWLVLKKDVVNCHSTFPCINLSLITFWDKAVCDCVPRKCSLELGNNRVRIVAKFKRSLENNLTLSFGHLWSHNCQSLFLHHQFSIVKHIKEPKLAKNNFKNWSFVFDLHYWNTGLFFLCQIGDMKYNVFFHIQSVLHYQFSTVTVNRICTLVSQWVWPQYLH